MCIRHNCFNQTTAVLVFQIPLFHNLTCHTASPLMFHLSSLLKTNTLIRNGEGLVPGLQFRRFGEKKNMFVVIDKIDHWCCTLPVFAFMFWRSQSMLPPMPFKLMARSQGHAQHAMWPHVVTLFCTCASLWPWAVLFNSECRFEAWARRPKHGISEVFVFCLCQQLKVLFFDVFRLLPFFRSRSLRGLSSSNFWEPRWGVRRGKWQLQEFWTSWHMMHWNRWKRTFKESKDGWGISSAGFFVESICSFTEATDFPIGSDFHMAPPASLPETNHLQRWCCRGLWKILAGPGSQASSVPCLCFRLVPPPPAVAVDPPPMDVWPEDPVCQLAGCLKGVGWSVDH